MLKRLGLGNIIVASGGRLMVGLTGRPMRPVSFSGRTDIAGADYRRLRADARRPGQGRVRFVLYQLQRAPQNITASQRAVAPEAAPQE